MILEALFNLRPDAKWRWEGEDYNDIEWLDEVQTKPTLEELQVEADRLNAEKIANRYQAKRAVEYPPITDYLDGIVKGDQEQIQAYIDACNAVKAKYPKGK